MAEEQPIEISPEDQKSFPDDYYVYDKEDALHDILAMPDHIKQGYDLARETKVEQAKHIVIAGMGGSGIAGDLIKTFIEHQEDASAIVEVVKGYECPRTVGKHTLFIAISYSGNTEETLSCYKNAHRKGAQLITISSGGKLQELAKLNRHEHLSIPKNLQPRMAIGYLFFPVLRLLENAGIAPAASQEVSELAMTLKRQDVTKQALALSEKTYEKIPIIYADQSFYPVAYRWKTQFNENAKTPAFTHAFSEMNHNELLAFSNRNASFHVFMLSTDKEHRRIVKRMQLSKELLQKKGVSVTEINIKGPFLKQMFTTIFLGDLTSYYLALRYETDPTPVALIEQFKKDLGPFLI